MMGKWLKSFEHVPPTAMRRLLSGFVWEGTPDSGSMALTFDDGPDPEVTPAVLDVLDELGARGTFFLVGEQVRLYPDVARLVAERGHQVGNHSLTHPRMLFMKRAEVEREIDEAQRIIADAAGVEPTLFRPPYGIFDFTCAGAVRDREMDMTLWTVLSGDYSDDSAEIILRRVNPFVRPGAIVVFHDTRKGGGSALVKILRETGALAGERKVRLGAVEELSRSDEIQVEEESDV
jgi:peptidoglycan-N-acetylglucosamine deacetylase